MEHCHYSISGFLEVFIHVMFKGQHGFLHERLKYKIDVGSCSCVTFPDLPSSSVGLNNDKRAFLLSLYRAYFSGCIILYYIISLKLNIAACQENSALSILTNALILVIMASQITFFLVDSFFVLYTCSVIISNSVHHQGNETSIHWGLVLIDLVHHEEKISG